MSTNKVSATRIKKARPARKSWRLPTWRGVFDTLFARIAVFAVLVLFAVQAGWFTVLTIQRPRHDADGYARGVVAVIQASYNDHADRLGQGKHASFGDVWNVRQIPLNAKSADVTFVTQAKLTPPMARLRMHVGEALPKGSDVEVEDSTPPRLWVRVTDSNFWIAVPVDAPPPGPPILLEAGAMMLAAILVSLGAAWQMQRPMSRVAQVARRFGTGERPLPVTENGPREIRELIYAVNQMMQRISESEDERSLMLAGIAHDLKAPLTRMKLRASVLEDELERMHFDRDVDSLSHIVQQFLEFAGSEPSDGEYVEVDTFVAAQFSAQGDGEAGIDASLFVHRLRAGSDFRLPRTVLDRLLTNLVDNALDHGEPPVAISTYRQANDWILEVRDHGAGIPAAMIEEASKPFARLDPSRSGDGHCGLGLAIVVRLARKHRGHCHIDNAPSGGLRVKIILPAGVPAD